MNGWVVALQPISGNPPEILEFAVREADAGDAVEAVQRYTGAGDDQMIRVISPLSDETIANLGLEPGEVMELTPS
jgi:hypothetical protein